MTVPKAAAMLLGTVLPPGRVRGVPFGEVNGGPPLPGVPFPNRPEPAPLRAPPAGLRVHPFGVGLVITTVDAWTPLEALPVPATRTQSPFAMSEALADVV